jgi:hypothetical protein
MSKESAWVDCFVACLPFMTAPVVTLLRFGISITVRHFLYKIMYLKTFTELFSDALDFLFAYLLVKNLEVGSRAKNDNRVIISNRQELTFLHELAKSYVLFICQFKRIRFEPFAFCSYMDYLRVFLHSFEDEKVCFGAKSI